MQYGRKEVGRNLRLSCGHLLFDSVRLWEEAMKETTSSNETGARFTTKGIALTVFIVAAYLGTWLPHFGIFNSLTWIGPLT